MSEERDRDDAERDAAKAREEAEREAGAGRSEERRAAREARRAERDVQREADRAERQARRAERGSHRFEFDSGSNRFTIDERTFDPGRFARAFVGEFVGDVGGDSYSDTVEERFTFDGTPKLRVRRDLRDRGRRTA
jgi:phosphate uptake regulator